MKTLFLSVLAILLISQTALHAQSQFSGWVATFNTIKVGKKISIHNDNHWRSSDELVHMQTLLLRVGLIVHLTSRATVTGGYAYVQNRRVTGNVSGYPGEQRVWEQFQFTHRLGSFYSNQRFRLEQRFIPRTVVVNNKMEREGFNYANRFRYFTRHLLPFKKQTPFRHGVYGAIQDEVFLNFGNKQHVNGKTFDQNRFGLSIGHRLHSKVDVEIGYANQYISGRNGSFTNNHVVQLAGYLRL